MKSGIERLSKLALGDKEMTVLPLTRLSEAIGADRMARLTLDVYAEACEQAGSSGMGIEPDPRYTDLIPRLGESVVVFRLQADPKEPSGEFRAAAAVMGLAGSVASADDEVVEAEEDELEARLEQSMNLGIDESARLKAWCKWLMLSKPRIHSAVSTAKERLADLPEEERESIGSFAIQVAAADRIVKPSEVSALEKVFAGLGLEKKDLKKRLSDLDSVHVVGDQPDRPTNRDSGRTRASRTKKSRTDSQADALMEILFGT